jgi:hypothetical protein
MLFCDCGSYDFVIVIWCLREKRKRRGKKERKRDGKEKNYGKGISFSSGQYYQFSSGQYYQPVQCSFST